MIKLLLFLMMISIFSYQQKAQAVSPEITSNSKLKKSVQKPTVDKDKKLSTQVDFNDHLVGGTYQKPLEALTVVEDDKSLESLIGMRKNFKDREKKMKELK